MMLSFIHRELLPAVVECSKEPHRNSLLRAMRTGKKNIAEARQADLFRLVDAGESIPKDGMNVDAAAMLTYVRPLDAAPAEAAPQQQSEAGQLLAYMQNKPRNRRRHRKLEKADRWRPHARSSEDD